MDKKIIRTEIISNKLLIDGVYKLWLHIPQIVAELIPGQFVNLYLNNREKILPRPFSVCDVDRQNGNLAIVYEVAGEGTQELASYCEGQIVRVSTPLGNGFDMDISHKKEKYLLVGGGLGIAPLLFLSKEMKSADLNFAVVLGYRSEPFLVEEFKKICQEVFVCTESESYERYNCFSGNVMDIMTHHNLTAAHFLSCGPTPMLRAVANFAGDLNAQSQVSLEERMGCGFGACVGCAIDIMKDGALARKKVCKDGPVFDGKEVFYDGR